MSQVVYTVVKGDNLTKIAKKYNTTVKNLAALNNIKNPNLIYIGQKIIISGKTITPDTPSTSNPNPSPSHSSNGNFVTIHTFGIQANTENTIFAVWSWFGQNTLHYEVEWSYYTANGIWFNGNKSTTELTESIYTIPSNALRIRCRVKPVSTKWQDANGNEHDHWIGVWCGYSEYNVSDTNPKVPPTPTVEVSEYKLHIRNDNLDINATEMEYEVIQNEKWVYAVGIVGIERGTAMYTITMAPGWPYKVRARGRRGDICGKWSDYTSNFTGSPGEPHGEFELKAIDKNAVQLVWKEILGVESYSIQYAEKEIYLDASNNSTTVDNIKTTSYIIGSLKTGTRYYFRYKGVNKNGSSIWSNTKTIVLGEKPNPPSTWSDKTVAVTGEKVLLSWTHNTVDGSEQTVSEIEFEVNGVKDTHTIGMDINQKPINTFELPTFMFADGTKVNWRVRTKGVLPEFSEWSTTRVIDVYAPPSLSLRITDNSDRPISEIKSFPFYIKTRVSTNSQKPMSYVTIIRAKQSYVTNTAFGPVEINAGDEVYSSIINTQEDLNLKMHAGIIDLENGIEYYIECTVTMGTGLTADAMRRFTVKWGNVLSNPNAEVIVDKERLSVNIRPYTEIYRDLYKVVTKTNGKYIETNTELSGSFNTATSINDAVTDTNKQVYMDERSRMFCVSPSGKVIRVNDSTLSVYRRTYDGKFICIADNLDSSRNTFVTDPHPPLDYARYRIVASDNKTGTISFSDIKPRNMGENSIVIQWNELWSNFMAENSSIENVKYSSGSMIKLPYNINISESNDPDISTINYIGREHPVSYYGTNLGVTSNWSSEIDKNDIELLYAVRRLSMYMGDVYVREPSGVGYWATVGVTYDKSYDSLVIPITLSIKRVEGGI